jgi:hypothetical protein
MNSGERTLQWSEKERSERILNGEQLEQALDRLHASADAEYPPAVVLRAFGCSVHILIGLVESFVYVDDADRYRYFVTIGNPDAEGVIGFYLLGEHHTEFERRHLIPISMARRVVREFYDTGHRSSFVQWEEGSY